MDPLRHYLTFFTLFKALTVISSLEYQGAFFIRRPSCNISELLSSNCVEAFPHSSNLIDCAVSCVRQNESCFGCSLQLNGSFPFLWRHRPCVAFLRCHDNEEGLEFYAKVDSLCLNGGRWNGDLETCTCVNSWVGEYCERLPNNCSELETFNYRKRNWATLQLLSMENHTIGLSCYIREGGFVNTMVFSNDGDMNVNRTWAQYVNGFYFSKLDYWVGLNNLVTLLDEWGTGYPILDIKMLTKILSGNVWHNTTLIYRYKNFEMGNQHFGYNFSFESFTLRTNGEDFFNLLNQTGDCLGPLRGARFSTWDHDQDDEEVQNCAAVRGGGGWFKTCNVTCHPFGAFYNRLAPDFPRPDRMELPNIDFHVIAPPLKKIWFTIH